MVNMSFSILTNYIYSCTKMFVYDIWNATIILFSFFLPPFTSFFIPFFFLSSTSLSLSFFLICMLVPAFLSGFSLQYGHICISAVLCDFPYFNFTCSYADHYQAEKGHLKVLQSHNIAQSCLYKDKAVY